MRMPGSLWLRLKEVCILNLEYAPQATASTSSMVSSHSSVSNPSTDIGTGDTEPVIVDVASWAVLHSGVTSKPRRGTF